MTRYFTISLCFRMISMIIIIFAMPIQRILTNMETSHTNAGNSNKIIIRKPKSSDRHPALLRRLGVVVAVVSNERLSSAVSEARASVQNNVQDLDTFLRNTKMQLRFLVSNSLEQTVDAIYGDLDGRALEVRWR